MSVRPWHLVGCLDSLLAECRTAPGVWHFQRDYERLAARADEARRLVLEADHQWPLWRDYAPSVAKLAGIWLEGHSLRVRLAVRQLEQKEKLTVFLNNLRGNCAGGIEQQDLVQVQAPKPGCGAAPGVWSDNRRFSLRTGITSPRWIWWRKPGSPGNGTAPRAISNSRALKIRASARDGTNKPSICCAGPVRRLAARYWSTNWSIAACCSIRGVLRGSTPHSWGGTGTGARCRRWMLQLPKGSTGSGKRKRLGNTDAHCCLTTQMPLIAAGSWPRKQRSNPRCSAHRRKHRDSRGVKGDQDWTDGCVSLADADMRDLYRNAYAGMPVTIVGTCSLAAAAQEQDKDLR